MRTSSADARDAPPPTRPIKSPSPEEAAGRREYPHVLLASAPPSSASAPLQTRMDLAARAPTLCVTSSQAAPSCSSGGVLVATSIPHLRGLKASASSGALPPSRRASEQLACSLPSCSAVGAMAGRSGTAELCDAPHRGLTSANGSCAYLQRLPPVIRRSVCNTGARQRAHAASEGPHGVQPRPASTSAAEAMRVGR